MFLPISRNRIIWLTLRPINMIICWGSLWSESLKHSPKAAWPMSDRDSCLMLKLFSHVHFLSAQLMTIEWEQTMTVSWLKCQQTPSFSPEKHSAHPNTKPNPAFPSLCSSVYRNVLSCSFHSWLWEGCQHVCFSWRRTWLQVSQSGGFRSSLQRSLFTGLHLGSSFLVGDPWFPNFMKLPPPAHEIVLSVIPFFHVHAFISVLAA